MVLLFFKVKIIEEFVHLPDQNAFRVSRFSDVVLDYPMHHHAHFYELTLTIGVSGVRVVGDDTASFTKVDLVLMAPGIPHCWRDHGVKVRDEDQEVIVIHFSDQLFGGQLKWKHYGVIKKVLDQSRYGLELKGKVLEQAAALMSGIHAEASFEDYVRLISVLQLFKPENQPRRLCSEGYSFESKQGESKMEKVYAYIQDHYQRKLSIAEVAAQVHMSPGAFSHFFKKRALKSYTDFVMELRLGRATRLLQYTDEPISKIAYHSGFQNISHFNRSFRKRIGNTPFDYRKEMKRLM